MVCKGYLAVTEKELKKISAQPVAWMACRFDKRGLGLENLPTHLPQGALILVDDLQPITGHSPAQVSRQLTQLCSHLHPAGIVLDLQRKPSPAAIQMVKALIRLPEIPVAVTAEYARGLNCPVFLPAPIHIKLQKILTPWRDREIWLDLHMGQITVTGGNPTSPQAYTGPYEWDRFLCCGYAKTGSDSYALCRSKGMLPKIYQEAGRLGISKALVLYSEL